jgi:hypothetical protein
VIGLTYVGSDLQPAIVAYVRCDFPATRAASFVTTDGITAKSTAIYDR